MQLDVDVFENLKNLGGGGEQHRDSSCLILRTLEITGRSALTSHWQNALLAAPVHRIVLPAFRGR